MSRTKRDSIHFPEDIGKKFSLILEITDSGGKRVSYIIEVVDDQICNILTQEGEFVSSFKTMGKEIKVFETLPIKISNRSVVIVSMEEIQSNDEVYEELMKSVYDILRNSFGIKEGVVVCKDQLKSLSSDEKKDILRIKFWDDLASNSNIAYYIEKVDNNYIAIAVGCGFFTSRTVCTSIKDAVRELYKIVVYHFELRMGEMVKIAESLNLDIADILQEQLED